MNGQNNIRDRQKGCLYGLACGDALGAAVEFKHSGEFSPVTCYRGFGPHGLSAGQWTDDTSMALALADSLGKDRFDMKDQLSRYLDWFQNGRYSVNGHCFDIGNTCRHALYDFESDDKIFANEDESCSGNGSIMRLAPVAIKYYDKAVLLDYALQSSQTTHGSKSCKSACVYLAHILGGLIRGENLDNLLNVSDDELESFGVPPLYSLISNIRNGSYKSGKVKGSGWVVESLEAAIWAVWSSSSFEEAVLKAVNLGDDADTTGAVAGQIAGALYGFSGIPSKLIDGLDKKDMIDLYLNPLLIPNS